LIKYQALQIDRAHCFSFVNKQLSQRGGRQVLLSIQGTKMLELMIIVWYISSWDEESFTFWCSGAV